MKDWVVALLPRTSADRVIRAQAIKRATIAVTEQYYRFVDPEVGPMIGAFAPTGNALAKLLADAFGGDTPPRPRTKTFPSPAPEMLLIGCNPTTASQEDFLTAARSAEDMVHKAGANLRGMAEDGARHEPH